MMKLFSNISLRIDIKSKNVISKCLLCFSNKKENQNKRDCSTMPRGLFKQFRFIFFTFACKILDRAHKLQVFFFFFFFLPLFAD